MNSMMPVRFETMNLCSKVALQDTILKFPELSFWLKTEWMYSGWNLRNRTQWTSLVIWTNCSLRMVKDNQCIQTDYTYLTLLGNSQVKTNLYVNQSLTHCNLNLTFAPFHVKAVFHQVKCHWQFYAFKLDAKWRKNTQVKLLDWEI